MWNVLGMGKGNNEGILFAQRRRKGTNIGREEQL